MIKGIEPKMTDPDRLLLGTLSEMIIERFPCVQMIVHLGSHRNSFLYYLLILIDDKERSTPGEMTNKIANHCCHLNDLHIFIYQSGVAKAGIIDGNRFLTAAITNGDVIHQSSKLQLPHLQNITNDILIEQARFNWKRWGIQGGKFLEGVNFYLGNQEYQLAVFLLHESVESTLKAIIQGVLGYEVREENLSKLLQLTLLMTGDLNKAFRMNDDEYFLRFFFLQNAYFQIKYGDDFAADKNTVIALNKTVKHFYKLADQLCRQFIETLEGEVTNQKPETVLSL